MGLKDALSALMPRKVFLYCWNPSTSEWDPASGVGNKALTFWPKTGSAALAETLAPGVAWQLHEVRLHVVSGPGGSGTLTAICDNGTGAPYDHNYLNENMTAQSDVLWQPANPIPFKATDELDFAWANAGGKTYGLEVIYSLR